MFGIFEYNFIAFAGICCFIIGLCCIVGNIIVWWLLLVMLMMIGQIHIVAVVIGHGMSGDDSDD